MNNYEIPQVILDRRNEMRQNMQHLKSGKLATALCGMVVDYFVEGVSYQGGQITNVTLKKH